MHELNIHNQEANTSPAWIIHSLGTTGHKEYCFYNDCNKLITLRCTCTHMCGLSHAHVAVYMSVHAQCDAKRVVVFAMCVCPACGLCSCG